MSLGSRSLPPRSVTYQSTTNLIFISIIVSIASRRPIPARTGRAIYFTMSLAFTTVIWYVCHSLFSTDVSHIAGDDRAARVSIACSIMRLLPPGWTRRAVVYIIGLFGLAWLHFMVKTSLICGKNHVWISYCPLGFAFGIEKLISEPIIPGTFSLS